MGVIYDIDMQTWYFEKKKKNAQLARIFPPPLIFQVFKFASELQHGKELVSHLLNPARHLAAAKIPGGGGGGNKAIGQGALCCKIPSGKRSPNDELEHNIVIIFSVGQSHFLLKSFLGSCPLIRQYFTLSFSIPLYAMNIITHIITG